MPCTPPPGRDSRETANIRGATLAESQVQGNAELPVWRHFSRFASAIDYPEALSGAYALPLPGGELKGSNLGGAHWLGCVDYPE
jgi:hypothetical protein